MRVEIDGCGLHVDVAGRGSPIIAHHGAPGLASHANPKRALAPLTDTHTVITFDARGSGLSDGTPPFTHDRWVADLDGLRAHFGYDAFILEGGSYGGFIALEYALRHQERLTHLILRDTAARNTNDLARANAMARAAEFPAITEDVLDRIFEGTVRDDADYRRCFEAIAPLYQKEYDPEQVQRQLDAITFRHETKNFAFSRNLPNYDLRARLPSVSVPTLIVVGRHDWITPVEFSEELAGLLPNSELVVFENSGHSPHLEENERFVALVRDFLTRHGAYD